MKTASWRTVPCPTCGARLGESCKTVNPYKLTFCSQRSSNPHAARVWAAKAPHGRVDGDTGLRAFVAMKIAEERFDRAEERRRQGDVLIRRIANG